jgi:GAF domain-containing protein
MTDDLEPAAVVGAGLRERLLAEVFVGLADTLVDDYDVLDLLDRLTTACVGLLGVAAAGILLDDQRGNLAVVATSSERTRLLEVFQLQNDEGPCLDCVRSATPVVVADLRLELLRWPLFAPAAVSAGFLAVAAVPMRLREQVIGGLNLFSTVGEEIAADDRALAQAFADVAAIGILHRRSAHRSEVVAEQLQHALNSRVVIEQAKGVVAERSGLSMEDAFDALRSSARSRNEKLTDLALAVVEGRADLGITVTGGRTGA